MWKSVIKTVNTLSKNEALLCTENVLHQQLRTTFVLKRKYAPPLHKKNEKPKTLRSKHYVYDLVHHEDSQKKPNIEVILNTFFEGLGNKGDKVSLRPNYAYDHLLLPGLAVYVTPENVEKYKSYTEDKVEVEYSTPSALLTVKSLQRMSLSVVMNKETPWVLKPWHIKVSFRKCGYVVPENAITLPEQEIKGPNLDIENKEFFVTVTINNMEKVPVRCRLHHWSTNIKDRLPRIENFWLEPSDPIIEGQAEALNTMPRKQ